MRLRPNTILSKLLALFLIAAVVPLGLLGVFFYHNSMRAIADMVGNRTSRLAQSAQSELETKLSLRLSDRLLAANQPVQDYLEDVRWRGAGGLLSLATLRTYLAEVLLESGEFYEDLVLAGADGEPLLRYDRSSGLGPIAIEEVGPAVAGKRADPAPMSPPPPVPPPAAPEPPGSGGGTSRAPFRAGELGVRPALRSEEDRRGFRGAQTLAPGVTRLQVDPGGPGHEPAVRLLMPVESTRDSGVRLGYVLVRLRSQYLWPKDWENRRFGAMGELAVVDPASDQVLYHTRSGWAGRPLGQVDPQLLELARRWSPGERYENPWRWVPGTEGDRVATPLSVSGTPWMVVATALPREFASEARRTALLNLLVGTLALVAAVSLIAIAGKRMSRSIKLLTARAQQVARGELSGPPLRVETHDEVQTLAGSFNVMTESLRRNIEMRERAAEELDALNRSLETRVQERTRRLEELNAALNRANEELKELDRLKSNFLATVSHEFKTPLTSIKAFAEILHDELDERGGPEEMKRFLRIIDSESDRLARLIKNILDLSRIESGRMMWRMANFPARAVIDATLDGLLPALKEKHIRVERDTPCADAVLHGDQDRLQEVLTNVMDNAIKASAEGQRIVLGCRDHEGGGNGPAGMLHFFVTDQGHGIPGDQLEKIFDRFHQVSAEGRRRKGGTGLGLAISREITEYHGGRIWAESEPGRGSTFHVTLPRVSPARAAQSPAAAGSPPDFTPPGEPHA